MEKTEVCMQCSRHCPITELRCGRGRAALNRETGVGTQLEHTERDYSRHHGRRRGHGEGHKRHE